MVGRRTMSTTRLLVSVVDADEVTAAVAGGADIIDVKNPREGSLGAGVPHVIRDVRERTPAEVPVSAAIGDMPDLPGTAALAAAGAAACGVQYVKVGLLGPRDRDAALTLLGAVCRAVRDVDDGVRVMATAYADARRTGSVLPLDLPGVAAEAGAAGCMIDTAAKGSVTLLSELDQTDLAAFVASCRRSGLVCALAGSLREEDLPLLCELEPDIIGFRGAACGGDRVAGRVDEGAVRRLKELLGQA
jgi:uncharacterized protein (UPF0264 family)